MRFFLLLFLFCFSTVVLAQQSDSQLAYTYYQNKEYDKAAEIFLQLYERNRASYYLDYHIICLINAKEYDKAESTLKKYLKADDNNKEFLVTLGYIYEQQGKTQKSEEYYAKAIKKLIPYANDIYNLANKFRNIREYGWANKTYLRGRELLKKPEAFRLELGENYMMDRDYENMLTIFLQVLKTEPGRLNDITSKLAFARSYDVSNNVDKVIENSLEKIFKQSDYPPVFDELEIWYALQTENYAMAFEYAVKLNHKIDGKLHIYINIAREAQRAHNYQIAEKAYLNVIQQGKEKNDYYNTARKEILLCRYTQYQETKTTSEQYKQIAGDCKTFLTETGYTNSNTDIISLMSDIYAYQLNMPDTANQILQQGINIPRLDFLTQNLLKSKRADLLTYMDNPWEAVILYTQVEKANPNNDIGYEAKLKKAQLAYYEGDLLWAKAQFDVLKGSTTKSISNDAIKISHFINSNYEEEGDNSALQQLAETEYMIYKGLKKEALPALDSLISHCQPGIADYASLLKARLLLSQFQIQEAAQLLQTLSDQSEQTYIRAEAIYELANLKARTQEKQKALELYKSLVSDYSGSVYSVEAGKRYREMEKEK